MTQNQPYPETSLDNLAQMSAALAAPQDYPQRLQRFLEQLCTAAGIHSACILQLDRTNEQVTWLAGVDLSHEALAASASLQQRLRDRLQDDPGAAMDAATVLPVHTSGNLLTALYLEALAPGTIPLVRAAAAALSLAVSAEQMRLEGEQSRQARQKFISVVTHELRIPMTSIKGYTDLLRQGIVGPVTPDQQNFLTVIRNNVDRMSALVSDLSDLSRMETGRLRINLATLQVQACIQEAVETHRSALEEKRQRLVIDAPADLPAVRADQARLVQIISVLLHNAHLYSPAGSEIRLSAKVDRSQLLILVRDHGAGVSEQDQPHVFEAFFRSEDAAIREHPGWGLSLSVARGLVQMMQGRIAFESQPGQGSLFWFSLPLAVERQT